MARKKTHPLWQLATGGTASILTDATHSWKISAKRIGPKRGVVFQFNRIDDRETQVVCYDDFEYEPPSNAMKRHPLHFMAVGDRLAFSAIDENAYRSTAHRIERASEKRFSFSRQGDGRVVDRLADGTKRVSFKAPKSKYGFGNIAIGDSKLYLPTMNLNRVSWSLDRFAKTSGYTFNKEWCEDGLRVCRLS